MQDVETRELTDMQAAFVDHFVATGGKVGIAATRAGYADRAQGSKLLRDPKITKAIQQRVHDEIGTAAVSALGTVVKLAKSAKSDYVRLEAAKDLLNRAGYVPPDKHLLKVSGDLTVSFDIAPQGPVIEHETEEGGVENR
jgi:hypothetical protein